MSSDAILSGLIPLLKNRREKMCHCWVPFGTCRKKTIPCGFNTFSATPSRSEPKLFLWLRNALLVCSRINMDLIYIWRTGFDALSTFIYTYMASVEISNPTFNKLVLMFFCFVTEHLSCPARIEIDGHEDITPSEDIFAILRRYFSDWQ